MFWIEIILLAVSLFFLIIGIAWFEDKVDCGDFMGNSGNSCDTFKTWMYVVLALQLVVGVTIDIMIGMVVINGKQEQIEYNEKEGKKATQPQQPMQPGQQTYPTVPQQDVEMGIPMQPQPGMVQQPVLTQ